VTFVPGNFCFPTFLGYPIKSFMRSSFSCAFSFRKLTPNAGDRDAHFQQPVIDTGMSSILWVPYLVQRQVGGDDQRLLAVVPSKPEVIVSV
jgi:hypothetical protein